MATGISAQEITELSAVCPVTEHQDVQGNAGLHHESLQYSVIREIKKAIKEFGLTSSYTRGMLEGLSTGYALIPWDWRALMRMV